ncbi:SPW repeat domain-containing protein [Halomicrococcus sp. NG-SE-24]|uniref:SPW repeat domain-containing protein n=1 Tax=Halomicrococcus sp. NG-SE-24 TaxID=3436928 RepID=UPI003D95D644
MRGNLTAVGGPLLGTWLLTAPFVVFASSLPSNLRGDLLSAATLLAVGLYATVRVAREEPVSPAAPVLVALIGLVQVTQPFVVGSASVANRWNDVAVGVALVALAVAEFRTDRRPDEATSDDATTPEPGRR